MSPILLGLGLGIIYGAAARAGKFCLLRGMKGVFGRGDLSPLRAFALAMAVAILATQLLNLAGGTDLSASLPLRERFSWVGLLAGGAVFGLGSVLANACGGRSLVLAAGGNLRSVLVLAALGIAAQASQTGVLAGIRTQIQGLGVAQPKLLSIPDVLQSVGFAPMLALGLAVALTVLVLLAFALPLLRGRALEALSAIIIGATIAGGWWVTYANDDPFDPKILTSISFIGPTGDGVLWMMLSTGRALNFGIAVVAGTLVGAFAAAVLRRDFTLETFTSTRQTLSGLAGGVLMGFGGVLALGCSIGQGLSGVSTLSLASLVAFVGILSGIALGLAVFRKA